MLVPRKYLAGILLATFLWAGCALGLFGMFESKMVMAGIGPVYRGSADAPNVALMFNVDWGGEYLVQILDVLADKKAVATFFPTGTWCEDNPTILTRIVNEGHELGTHGASHLHVEGMSRDELQKLIRGGDDRIFDAIGARPSKIFAPPYGEWTGETVAYATEAGYLTIMWTVDTIDWRLPPADAIWKRALAGADNGTLVLMHPTEPTVAALPTLIDGLRERGFAITTVTDCIAGKK